MSALIAPATQAALLPSGNVEATDPAYELDFTGDHKYQGGTVTFTQDEISFRGDAFEIAKDAAPTMLNGEGKIFFIELGHLTIGESTAPQAFKLVGNNIEIFISDTKKILMFKTVRFEENSLIFNGFWLSHFAKLL